jgi:hypothetical protein
MIDHELLLKLLDKHFDLNKYEVHKLPDPNQVQVKISLVTDKYNEEHFWYRWDWLCSQMPSFHGGSWKAPERSTSDGYDHFEFTLVFPTEPISESQ